MDNIEHEYRPINLEFLDMSGKESFDIFYRTELFGEVKFVLFATTQPAHQEKVRNILESGELQQQFYINEKDLFKYYQHATATLRTIVKSTMVPQTVKAKKIYEVSKGIMHEFFEYQTSSKILTTSEEVMEIMDDCLSSAETGFYAIAQITNKDYYTYTHSVNVGLYCMTFAVKTKMSQKQVRELGLGGMLHDVGKSKMPHDLINKSGKLSDDEFAMMKGHPTLGEDILRELKCYSDNVVHMAGQHHEKYNGGGYPRGMEGEQISFHARVCKIMDVYDALTTRRSYKKAMTPFDTLVLMKKQMGPEFDNHLLDQFIKLMGPEM
jgi:HD-GYP domain-containing protein (c-di-GMP phosphodiesterase class II)